MTARLFILTVFISLIVVGFAIPGPLRSRFNNNIDISIAENKETIRLVASYPTDKSKNIHQYIKDFFGITDITDLEDVEVKQYQTPDKSMRFHIKSRNGYLKLVMKKEENTQAAIDKLREAAGGIKRVLANN